MLTNSLLFIEDPSSDRNCFRTPVAGASGRSVNSAKVSCINFAVKDNMRTNIT